jgi:hypothetical protein
MIPSSVLFPKQRSLLCVKVLPASSNYDGVGLGNSLCGMGPAAVQHAPGVASINLWFVDVHDYLAGEHS